VFIWIVPKMIVVGFLQNHLGGGARGSDSCDTAARQLRGGRGHFHFPTFRPTDHQLGGRALKKSRLSSTKYFLDQIRTGKEPHWKAAFPRSGRGGVFTL